MSRTECIPQRECAVVYPTVCLMYLLVRTIILAVHIAIDCRSNHGVIQSCIEIHSIVGISTNHLNGIQLVVPIGFSLSQILVEIIVRSFSLQVFYRSFYADTRQGRCNHQLIALFGIKHETGNIRSTHFFTLQLDFSVIYYQILKRSGESGCEIHFLTSCPTFRETITTNVTRIHHFNPRIHGKVPIHRLLQVQDNH